VDGEHKSIFAVKTACVQSAQRSFLVKTKRFFLFGLPAVLLAMGVVLAGCASAPNSFQKGSGGETTILLRQGLDFDQALREVAFVLNRHGFESEMLQPEVGYIRTRWIYTWNDTGTTTESYRVRITCSFNPNRTQLIIKADAEFAQKGRWIAGFDTRAVETLRNDLNMIVGN
jgi:hypothetical protein